MAVTAETIVRNIVEHFKATLADELHLIIPEGDPAARIQAGANLMIEEILLIVNRLSQRSASGKLAGTDSRLMGGQRFSTLNA